MNDFDQLDAQLNAVSYGNLEDFKLTVDQIRANANAEMAQVFQEMGELESLHTFLVRK